MIFQGLHAYIYRMYQNVCVVHHHIQIPWTRYLAINRLYLYLNTSVSDGFVKTITAIDGCLVKIKAEPN